MRIVYWGRRCASYTSWAQVHQAVGNNQKDALFSRLQIWYPHLDSVGFNHSVCCGWLQTILYIYIYIYKLNIYIKCHYIYIYMYMYIALYIYHVIIHYIHYNIIYVLYYFILYSATSSVQLSIWGKLVYNMVFRLWLIYILRKFF